MSGEKEQTIEERMQEAEQSLRHIEWEERKIPLEMITEVADNIRPRDEEHVQSLANSISEIGQLQACLGDLSLDEGVRLIAGNHRKMAVEELNKRGEPTYLTVRVANRRLSPEEVLSVQMSENLHKEMKPSEDAVVIHYLWEKARSVYGDDISFEYIARCLGRTAEKVSKAVKFIKDVSPSVQLLVDYGQLPYSVALELRNLPRKSEGTYWDEQLTMAVFLMSRRYTATQSKKYIQTRINEQSDYEGTIFDQKEMDATKETLEESLKFLADAEGMDSVRWFTNIQMKLNSLPEGVRANFTRDVERAFRNMHLSFEEMIRSADGRVPDRQINRIMGEA